VVVIAAEHGLEPQKGLPAVLPDSERIVWQGAPDWRAVARHTFRIRWVSAYFAALLAWRFATVLQREHSVAAAVASTAWVLPIALVGIGLFLLVAWLTARTTVYTITTRRVVMRVGIALPVTVNLPFAIVESAALAQYRDGSGDLPLVLRDDQRASYLHLWPHVRPRRYARPEPMLRGIAHPEEIAILLSRALSESAGGNAAAPSAATRPVTGDGALAPAH
jgi:Bacterial PH domain